MASDSLQIRLCEPGLLKRIDAAAARAGLSRSEWSRRKLRAAVGRSEVAQQKAEHAADYYAIFYNAALLAKGEGAPL